VIENPTTTVQDVRIVYVVQDDQGGDIDGDRLEETVTIAPDEQWSSEDVLVDFFGVPDRARTQGSLHIFSPAGLIVLSTTYNENAIDKSTFGQELAPLQAADLVTSESPGYIADLKHKVVGEEANRVNLGLASLSDHPVEVEIQFAESALAFRAIGDPMIETVPPEGHLQIADIFRTRLGLGAEEKDDIVAYIRVIGPGLVYPYASDVTNRSGDPETKKHALFD
jgi:hypothetical protein